MGEVFRRDLILAHHLDQLRSCSLCPQTGFTHRPFVELSNFLKGVNLKGGDGSLSRVADRSDNRREVRALLFRDFCPRVARRGESKGGGENGVARRGNLHGCAGGGSLLPTADTQTSSISSSSVCFGPSKRRGGGVSSGFMTSTASTIQPRYVA